MRVVMQFSSNAEPWQRKSVADEFHLCKKGRDLTVLSPLSIGNSTASPEAQEYKEVSVEIGLTDQTAKVMNAYRQARRQAEWS